MIVLGSPKNVGEVGNLLPLSYNEEILRNGRGQFETKLFRFRSAQLCRRHRADRRALNPEICRSGTFSFSRAARPHNGRFPLQSFPTTCTSMGAAIQVQNLG